MRYPLNTPIKISNPYSASHPANDLAAPTGTPMFAPESGTIVSVNNDPYGYYGGMYVILMSNTNYRHYMGHNSKNHVVMGQSVEEGQHIADIGMTGFAIPDEGISAPSGPHTHWQVSTNGVTVDGSKLVTEEEMTQDAIEKLVTENYRAATDIDPTQEQAAYWVARIREDNNRAFELPSALGGASYQGDPEFRTKARNYDKDVAAAGGGYKQVAVYVKE